MESFTAILKHKSSHKWSERYDCDDPDSPVKNIYVLKTAFGGQPRPDKVMVTVTAG